MDIQVELARIVIRENASEQVIVLKEKDGERTVAMAIGIFEAVAIDRRLKGVTFMRPFTHDLIQSIIAGMGGHLDRVVVNDLREETFYALLIISQHGEVVEIDSRPSDAIALGIANDTPIFVADHVLDQQ